MADLSATERLERARGSLMVSEERLHFIVKTLPQLNSELEELILINETQGYKGRTIERTQSEINKLLEEKESLEKTISVLQKKLPELEKAWRIETASIKTIAEYRQSLTELSRLINELPAFDDLQEAIDKIQGYADELEKAQENFFSISQELNRILIDEKLQNIGDVDIEALRSNPESLDYQDILNFSDDLIDAGSKINLLQYNLYRIGTAILSIIDPPRPYIEETCLCGNHRREFKPGDNCWYMWEYQRDPKYFDVLNWILIHRDGGFDRKPEFPCEVISTPKPKAPKQQLKEKNKDIPGRMVYSEEEKTEDENIDENEYKTIQEKDDLEKITEIS